MISQLTRLPRTTTRARSTTGPPTGRATEGGRNLIEAARAAGAQRFVTQSVAFLYAPEGEMVKDEEARPWTDAPEPFRERRRVHARARARGPGGGRDGGHGAALRPVLRAGHLLRPRRSIAEQVRRRRFPIVGRGEGMFSFIHMEDAASATVAAVDRGAPGIYNVVDDEPAPLREWLPVYAEALGAKPPRRVPTWLARLSAGPFAVIMATELRGASNAKAKRELGWQPRYPSWREGFARRSDRLRQTWPPDESISNPRQGEPMAYSVPDLPYDYGALEPHIDEQTMRVHHDKHHQAYVDKANAALEGTEWADKDVDEVLRSLDQLPDDIRTPGPQQRRRALQPQLLLADHEPRRGRRARGRPGGGDRRRLRLASTPSRTSSRTPA